METRSLRDSVADQLRCWYHSFIVAPWSLPPELETIAWSSDRPQGEENHGA